jgi:hypothetical protein
MGAFAIFPGDGALVAELSAAAASFTSIVSRWAYGGKSEVLTDVIATEV